MISLEKGFAKLQAAAEVALQEQRALKPLWPEEYCSPDARTGWKFVRLLRTWNEAESETQPFPNRKYLRRLVREWCRCQRTGRSLIIEKSRRLVTSWLLRGLELWLMGRKRCDGVIVHRTNKDAAGHVWRIYHLYEDLRKRFPSWELPDAISYGPLAKKQLDVCVLPNGSKVEKHYEDPEGLQGSGYAFVTFEELSILDDPEGNWGQGKFVTQASAGGVNGLRAAVTNPSPNEDWRQLVKKGVVARELLDRFRRTWTALRGIASTWLSDGTRYVVLHYHADPEKDEEWARKEEPNPGRTWLRQMELHEDIWDGDPVFEDYDDSIHSRRGLVFLPHAVKLGGWDCGMTRQPAFAGAQLVPLWLTDDPDFVEWQLQFVREVIPEGREAMESFAPRVKEEIPGVEGFDNWADATVTQVGGQIAVSSQDVALTHGLRLQQSTNVLDPRLGAIEFFLKRRLSNGEPGFLVDPDGCPVLHTGFKGAYKTEVSKKGSTTGPGRIFLQPLKNAYSHIQDGAQYVAMRARTLVDGLGLRVAKAVSQTQAAPTAQTSAAPPPKQDAEGRILPPPPAPRRRR